jgi:hypothetical protein
MLMLGATTALAANGEFEVSLRQADPAAMAGGSVALEFELRYKGAQPFVTDSLEPPVCFEPWRPALRFDPPKGWKPLRMGRRAEGARLGKGSYYVCGRQTGLEIRKRQDFKGRIYLQDYFERITPGRHTLRFSLPLRDVNSNRAVRLVGTATVSLQPFDKVKFAAYVDELLAFVTKEEEEPADGGPAAEEDLDEAELRALEEEEDHIRRRRMERCKELLSLRHEEVLRAYTTILETKSLMFVHHTVRSVLAERTLESAAAREVAVKFVGGANEADRRFFLEFWKRNDIQLSQTEMETILGHPPGPVNR